MRPSSAYTPRAPAESVLYQIVRDHFETFRADAARAHDGDGLPRFIEEEFRGFLRCGVLAGGFARFHCGRCGVDRLVSFSCKGRAVCPSCGGRRMAERAAHLVDPVFPVVPVRQWVLSLPHRLRDILAWDHALCREVSASSCWRCLGFSAAWRGRPAYPVAAAGPWRLFSDSHPTAHTPRSGDPGFGAALNLNIHVHALVLDGVYVEDGRALRFQECDSPTDDEMDHLLGTIGRRLHRLLARRGLAAGDGGNADRWSEESPVLAGIAAASVQGRLALGDRAGAAVRRGGASAELLALAPQASHRICSSGSRR